MRLSPSDLSRPGTSPVAGGTVARSARNTLVWTGQVQVAEAHGLRLHLTGVVLPPPGTRAWIYGADGTSVPLSTRLLETRGASSGAAASTVEMSDSTLLELDGLPPNPYFLPWNPDPHESDVDRMLHVISHPGGGPQFFSRHRSVAECVNNEGAFSTKLTYGGVTGGSSGAPLLNADGEVIGQLWGGCSYVHIDEVCDPESFIFFGKLSHSYASFASSRPATRSTTR